MDAQECIDTYIGGEFSIGATPDQHVRDARRILVDAGQMIVNEALSDLESDEPDAHEPYSGYADG